VRVTGSSSKSVLADLKTSIVLGKSQICEHYYDPESYRFVKEHYHNRMLGRCYAWPMPTCDVVDCTSPATDTVPAFGVPGGRLYVCKSDMEKIASGTYTYMVHPEVQKLELRKKSYK
jgi:hypothetical protein